MDEDLATEEAGDEEMGQAADHDMGQAGAGHVDDDTDDHADDHVKIGAHEPVIATRRDTQGDTQEARGTSNETRVQEGLVVGARVKIHSLERSPELNGVEGEVLSFNASTGRWSVKTSLHSRIVSIGASHLTVMPAAGGEGGWGEEASSPEHMGPVQMEAMLVVEKGDSGTGTGRTIHSPIIHSPKVLSPHSQPAVLRTSMGADVDQVA